MKQAFFWLATVDSVKDSGKLWRDRNNLNSQQSVTVLITRRPRKSNQKEFERALSDTIDAALEFPGHLGVTVLKPPRGDNNDYQIIVKFASQADYQRWCHSNEAAHWFKILNRLEEKPPNLEIMTGLETWFAVNSSASKPMIPPPRYKMAIVTRFFYLLDGKHHELLTPLSIISSSFPSTPLTLIVFNRRINGHEKI